MKNNADFQRRVLVVDDEEVNMLLLGAILEQKYAVTYATNGQEAWKIIQEDGGEGISAVLLDLIMPEMDGFEVLRLMQEKGLLSKIPVIVLTAEKSAEVKSLSLGVADFLSKPYDPSEVILARVGHAIKLFEDARIIQATEYDSLTPLYTPKFFFEYSSQFEARNPDVKTDAIVINFTRFHLLNEHHGRATGDTVLKKIADALIAFVREHGGFACRYADDMFYLFVPHQDDYNAILSAVQYSLSEILSGSEIRIRMGIYADRNRTHRIERRFDRAQQACNSLRSQFGSSFAIYDTKMREKDVFDARLLQDFEKAIQEKQFKVSYQPKYNIKGSEPHLCSAEALVSWIHPELGRIRPDSFIPLFEENGLVQILDRYVWTEVARQLKEWKEKFGFYMAVSVNVSRVDILAPDIMDFILKITEENGVPHHEYLLEVTESAYTENSDQIIDVVRAFREKGFRVEMDDFGSGYSSLNMLSALPIDALKMDKAFIMNIERGNKEMRIVEMILDIAKFLNVPVVAEGVETKEQLDLLRNAGCDIIQGYYFSRPVPPQEFEAFIVKEQSLSGGSAK